MQDQTKHNNQQTPGFPTQISGMRNMMKLFVLIEIMIQCTSDYDIDYIDYDGNDDIFRITMS